MMNVNYIKQKINYIILIVMIWIAVSSQCVPKEPIPEPIETPENINRLTLDGWTPNVSIYAEDGSVNRFVLQNKAEYIAKVLYGTARYNSQAQQKTVVWCVLNRMESQWYPNSIEDVCAQPYQFKGYSDANPIDERLLRIAIDVLRDYYEDGMRLSAPEFVYMSSDNKDIVLRDSFNITKTTRYWRCKDDS